MSGARFGIPAVLLFLLACGAQDAGTPAVTLLSPEGVNHKFSRFSPGAGQVAYWAPGDSGWNLMIAGADLSGPRKLASGVAFTFWPPVWSPDGTTLAFGSTARGIMNLAVVPAQGGEVHLLTSSAGFNVPYEWHPSGDRISYVATVEGGTFTSWTVPLIAGGSAPLVQDTRPNFAHWSPDGSRVAYTLFDRGKNTIWVADSTGANPKQLTTEGQERLYGPGISPWSPDGSELLYVSRRTGTADIWVHLVNGGSPRQLTRDIRDDDFPTWSPDGKWVAFISKRGRQTDVWVVPAAGGSELRVTDDAAEEDDLHWIGKGSTLAFHTGVEARGLWAISVADGTERRITSDSIPVGTFDLSPDGREVVYQVLRGGGVSDLEVVSLAGGTPRTLVAGVGAFPEPDWSPNGKSIAFVSDRSGTPDIWVVAAAGGEPRQLTNWPTWEQYPEWSSDGASVYFTSGHDAAPYSDIWMVPATGGEPRRITSVGTIDVITVSRHSPDVFVSTFGGRGGGFVLNRLLPNGKLETFSDKPTAGVSKYGVNPAGDSLALVAGLEGGGFGSYLISTRTGQGRRILGQNEMAGDFSPDGTQLAYVLGSPNQDLGLYALKDGSTRRLTNTPENETQYWWTADGKTIVFNRSAERRRIATVDLTRLLGAGQ